MAAKVQTYRDLARWLKTLSSEQLNAPILATGGADDYGLTEYVYVVELVDVAQQHPQVRAVMKGLFCWYRNLSGSRRARIEVGQRAIREQAMSEKPRKRSVSRGRYIYLSSKRMSLTFLYSFRSAQRPFFCSAQSWERVFCLIHFGLTSRRSVRQCPLRYPGCDGNKILREGVRDGGHPAYHPRQCLPSAFKVDPCPRLRPPALPPAG